MFSSAHKVSVYKQTCEGFALVIALSLMAFILLLLISLSTFVRVESQSSEVQQNAMSARLDALLGLHVGLGRLQSAAGPDQRVTATGELLADADSTKSKYTGVWDADPNSAKYGQVVDWLISRSAATFDPLNDHTLAVDAGWPILVKARKVGDSDEVSEVRAGYVGIQGADDFMQGRFAFWVGDESVKARLNLENTATVPAVARVLGERSAVELGLSGAARSAYETSLSSGQIQKISDIEELPLLSSDVAEQSELRDSAFDSFHDLTSTSIGLLTNTRDGGLKHDLTVLFESDDATFEDNDMTAVLATDATTNLLDPRLVTTNHPDGLAVSHIFAAVHNDFTGDDRVPGPTWNVLRDYYRLYHQVEDHAGAAISPRRALPRPSGDDIRKGFRNVFSNVHRGDWHTRTKDGDPLLWPRTNKIHPVVTEARYFLSLRKVLNPDELPADPNDDYELQLVVDPIFTLWNPYNVDLDFTNYAMTFHMKGMPVKVTIVLDANNDGNLDGSGVDEHYETFLVDLMGAQGSQTSYRCAFSGGILPAGQVNSYSPNNTTPLPQTVDLDLELGWNQEGGYYAERIASNSGSPGSPSNYSRLSGPEDMSGWIMLDYEGNATDRAFRVRNFLIDDVSRRFDTTLGNNEPYAFEIGGYDMNVVKFRDTDAPSIGQIPFSLSSNPPIGIGVGEQMFFAEVDMHINAEDEIDVPLGQMSLMAYTVEGRLGLINQSPEYPATPLQQADVRELTSLAQVDGRFGSSRVAGGQKQVIMYDLPRGPLQSLAQLQHADYTVYGTQPMHVIGNSYPSPLVPKVEKIFKYSKPDEASSEILTIYHIDSSYFANEALWDSYFFSTLTDGDPATTQIGADVELLENLLASPFDHSLPNPRIVSIRADAVPSAASNEVFNSIDGYQKIGQYLGVLGAFNINSISVQAWEAILASTRGKTVSGESDFRRFTDSTFLSSNSSGSWDRYRSLSDADITRLATELSQLIRARGRPFLSLSDFINRELGSAGDGNDSGILQRAIENADLNSGFVRTSTLESGGDYGEFIPENSDGQQSAIGASTFLSQADVLSAIGSFITPRSDTFIIRSVGEHLDPITGDVLARAYCEATVQRMPVGELSEDREFRIVSMKWMDPESM